MRNTSKSVLQILYSFPEEWLCWPYSMHAEFRSSQCWQKYAGISFHVVARFSCQRWIGKSQVLIRQNQISPDNWNGWLISLQRSVTHQRRRQTWGGQCSYILLHKWLLLRDDRLTKTVVAIEGQRFKGGQSWWLVSCGGKWSWSFCWSPKSPSARQD